MGDHHRDGGRGGPWRAAATSVTRTLGVSALVLLSTLVMAAVIVLGVGVAAGPETAPAPVAQPPAPAGERVADRTAEQAAAPVRVRIPAIGVDAPVDPLVVDEHGVLPPPDSFEGTGWWRSGPEPGEIGPAVIAGHVDSYRGPAVFFRLDDLGTGDEIHIDRADGTTVVFTAQRTERHGKDEFPTAAVYGDTPDPQLRLITCGGDFDRQDRRYLDNVIVYATLAGA